MIEWGSVRVAQALLGTDNAFSAVERGDRIFVPVIFPVIFLVPVFDATIRNRDTTMKLQNENSNQVLKTRKVRYARADELELYSSSTTTLPVKRRHQLMLRFYSCSRIVDG